MMKWPVLSDVKAPVEKPEIDDGPDKRRPPVPEPLHPSGPARRSETD